VGFSDIRPEIFSHTIFPSAPHYHVVSKQVNVGFMSPIASYLRSFLLEGLYRRLGRFFGFVQFICADGLFTANMFPETANWLTPADEYVFYPTTCIPKLMSRQNYPRRYQRRNLMFDSRILLNQCFFLSSRLFMYSDSLLYTRHSSMHTLSFN
jgi:hypothetical protein